MINRNYKEFACIENLHEYKERFCQIVDFYGDELQDKIEIDGCVYTLHNFNNHCVNIYKIISNVLLNPRSAYVGKCSLNSKELYILDLAVLFHDISMSKDIMAKREDHSKRSADEVERLYKNSESCFYKKCGLNQNEIYVLKEIIRAHSDVKDGTVVPENNGLKAKKLNDEISSQEGKKIRSRFLAGILRLADELDITSERLGNTSIEENLRKAKSIYNELEMQIKQNGEGNLSDDYNKYKKYVESLEHWQYLHLFSQVYREEQDDKVYLQTDDEYICHLLDEGGSAAAITRSILNVYNKVMKEWNEVQMVVIEKSKRKVDLKTLLPIALFELKCDVKEINRELEKQHIIEKVKENKNSKISREIDYEKKDIEKQTLTGTSNQEVQVIDGALSACLEREINRRHLLKVGHFLLDDIFCARDWIDTKELVETKSIADKIVECFIGHMKLHCDLNRKHLIVGLDLEGALLASRIAMGMKMPFSYIIPVKEKPNSSLKELEIFIKKYDELVLITDAIVAYDTIKKALKEIQYSCSISWDELLNKVTRIYSIFYRESTLVDPQSNEAFKKITFCGNKDFPVELVRKNECHYFKQGNCMALNKKLREKSEAT